MEIKVGEYVRINNDFRLIALGIGKVIRINQDTIYVKNNFEIPFAFKIENVTKHSFNIIDLIEVGDYVNGYRILNMTDISNSDKTVFTIYKSDFKDICRIWGEEDIETILTHEQFEANCYKVKEQTNV